MKLSAEQNTEFYHKAMYMNNIGYIFNIQRFSLHDGPGIRTTVFLSGCTLRCNWCSNPESWDLQPRLFYTPSRCIKCKKCMSITTANELQFNEEALKIHRELIPSSRQITIAQTCPSGALSVKLQKIDAISLFKEIEKDIPFYNQRDGGVTFSGGEPLMQTDFLLAVLKMCRDASISVVIETAGNVQWECFEKIKEYVDLFLFDIKHMDPIIHKEQTGVSNEQILTNLKSLNDAGANIHVRVPVIPGFNDNVIALNEISTFLNALNIEKRTLLPFHQYGRYKYEALGRVYPMENTLQIDEKTIKSLATKAKFYRETKV